MRIDHIALRCKDRKAVAMFYIDAFGYKYDQKFRIPLGEEPDQFSDYADCVVLTPPERVNSDLPHTMIYEIPNMGHLHTLFHLASEIFISDGPPGGLIDRWVTERQSLGHNLLHHLAYQVDSVENIIKQWLAAGWGEFTTSKPIVCPEDGLIQVFTKPHSLTGLTYEFIQRPLDGKGFCQSSVRQILIASDLK